tara:strand:+ start:15152 stop:16168 length:1017 start_codon:yes stop_codon:yes gene_type:complete
MRKVEETGSVRVDLLGGTIDLNPINLILPNVVTLNLATELKAKVSLNEVNIDGIEINSLDYEMKESWPQSEITPKNLASEHFGPFKFVLQIFNHFKITSNVSVTLESGSPAGAGLGGSSAMGVTLYKALCRYCDITFDRAHAISIVNSIEARILDCGPAGYQDYYPALHGGILALEASPGAVEVHQLYSNEAAKFLEENLTLVYSGQTRLSGINNWEVYKAFFDRNETVRHGLKTIAKLSNQAFLALKEGDFESLPELISKEGATRATLFPGIVSPEMESLYNKIRADIPELGMKVCGAGGGGCFLLVHTSENRDEVRNRVAAHTGMSVLDFKVASPM